MGKQGSRREDELRISTVLKGIQKLSVVPHGILHTNSSSQEINSDAKREKEGDRIKRAYTERSRHRSRH